MSRLRFFISATLWLAVASLIASGVGCRGCNDDSTPTEKQQSSDPDGSDKEGVSKSTDTGESTNKEAVKGAEKEAKEPKKEGDETAKKLTPEEASVVLLDAAALGDLVGVEGALSMGANVHARDGQHCTSLMLAAFNGYESVVEILLEKGAEVNTIDPQGRTPLMFASTFNAPGTVKLLLEAGAKVNVRDHAEKFTALMFAASEGHIDVVQLLLEHEADKTLKDMDGDTAGDFARQNGHENVAELLNKTD